MKMKNNNEIRRAVGGAIIADDTGRILLGLRGPSSDHSGYWAWFGGGKEEGESDVDTFKREMFEETGYMGPYNEITKVKSYPNGDDFEYTVYYVSVPKEFTPDLNSEHLDARWYDIDDLPDNLFPNLYNQLQDVVGRKKWG